MIPQKVWETGKRRKLEKNKRKINRREEVYIKNKNKKVMEEVREKLKVKNNENELINKLFMHYFFLLIK